MKYHLFCFGLGYTALEIIKKLILLQPENWFFSGTKRVAPSQQNEKINIIEFDNLSFIPPSTTHILISIPPKEEGDLVFNRFSLQILKLVNLKWLGYLSTSGVYGDHQGRWVNESTHPNSNNLRSTWRLLAENQWHTLFNKHKIPAHIFRLSAIYGYMRSEIEKVLARQAQFIIKTNQYFSRIHVEDIAQIIIKSFLTPTPGEIYNLADDYPCSQAEVVEYACKLLKLIPPQPIKFEEAGLSEIAKSFYLESRKVRSDKIKKKLNIALKFPTYKEGLENIYNLYYKS